MAKERMVNTKFWDDTYIVNLDPIEKLLFLYFITNPLTNISGVYEIQLRRIAFDTGIDKDMVQKIIERFSRDNKIFYEEGWVGIKNFAKHQKNNPKIKKGIEIGLNSAPKIILDRLSIDYQGLSHSNSNYNLNYNSNSNNNLSNARAEAPAASPKEPKKEKDDNSPLSLEEFVKSMLESPQRHIKIIGDYADQIKPKFSTKAQWKVFISRNVRAARQLEPFTDEQIAHAFEKISENLKTEKNPKGYITKWTLETLLDYIHEN